MTDVTPGIITFGLGGDHNDLLLSNTFNLGPLVIQMFYPPSSGGGGYPGPAWNKVSNISNFYKPVETLRYTQLENKIAVSVKVTFKDKAVEKIYLVTPRQHNMLVSVLNIFNINMNRFSVMVKGLRNRMTQVFTKDNTEG